MSAAVGVERAGARRAADDGRRAARRDFLKLWGGQTASLFGTQISVVALPLTAALHLDAGPGQMGMLVAAGTAPYLVLGLPAGLRIDRGRRRPVLIGADLARFVLLLAIPGLAVAGLLTMPLLVAIALAIGTCSMLYDLAYPSYLPSLVGRHALAGANAKLGASRSVSELGGPGVAAVLVQAVGAPFALVVDALSFLGSALGLSTVRTPEPRPEPPDRRSARQEILEGLRTTFGHPILRAGACSAGTHNLCWSAMEAVLVLYVVRELGMGAGAYALALGVGAAGGLLGAVLCGRLARLLGVGRSILACAAVCCLAPLLIPLCVDATSGVVPLALAFLLRGLGGTPWDVQILSLRQTIVDDRLMGRVTSSYMLVSLGAASIGALAGGALGGVLGLRTTLLIGALGLSLAWLWLLLSPLRRVRTYDCRR